MSATTKMSNQPSRADLERALEAAERAGDERFPETEQGQFRAEARRLAGLTEPQTEDPHEANGDVSSPAEAHSVATATGQDQVVADLPVVLPADNPSWMVSRSASSSVAAPVIPVTAEGSDTRFPIPRGPGAAPHRYVHTPSGMQRSDPYGTWVPIEHLDTLQRQQQEAEARHTRMLALAKTLKLDDLLATMNEPDSEIQKALRTFEALAVLRRANVSLEKQLTEAQTTIATLTQERDALLDQVLRQVDALYLLLTADPHTTAVTFKAIRRLGSDLADLRAQPPADQG